jgi:hypothetical protein
VTGAREFRDAVEGLLRGDFSRSEPLFDGEPCPILAWVEQGAFESEPAALAEALSCACFLGRTPVVEVLLGKGVDPLAGAATGLNGFHWAANRGQLDTVRLLIRKHVALEVKNMYGGTVLGTAVWSAVYEPRPDHDAIIDALIAAGARRDAIGHPSGDPRADEVLRRHGA